MVGGPQPRSVEPAGSSRWTRVLTPARVAVLSYSLMTIAGALTLRLPVMHVGAGLSWIDSFFLSASSVCVTGLSPLRDVPGALSKPGEFVLLALIQVGGIGLVLLGAIIARAFGRRIGQRHTVALADTYGEPSYRALDLARHVFGATLLAEACGALFLAWRWRNVEDGAWHAVFHAVSAFCNAGFSSFSGGLAERRGDVAACSAILVLFVLGGIGFPVLAELVRVLRGRERARSGFSLHTRTVLVTSLALLILGALAILPGTSSALPFSTRCFEALFHAASARTAGFNLVDVAELGRPALLVLCFLMIIGASPASTGGGMKTVTFIVCVCSVDAHIRGKPDVTLQRRALFEPQVRGAMAIASVYVIALFALILGLTIVTDATANAPHDLLSIAFESCSALGTVGLSTGITPTLPVAGKLLLIVGMLVGRVGALTLVLFLGGRSEFSRLRYPRERLFLG